MRLPKYVQIPLILHCLNMRVAILLHIWSLAVCSSMQKWSQQNRGWSTTESAICCYLLIMPHFSIGWTWRSSRGAGVHWRLCYHSRPAAAVVNGAAKLWTASKICQFFIVPVECYRGLQSLSWKVDICWHLQSGIRLWPHNQILNAITGWPALKVSESHAGMMMKPRSAGYDWGPTDEGIVTDSCRPYTHLHTLKSTDIISIIPMIQYHYTYIIINILKGWYRMIHMIHWIVYFMIFPSNPSPISSRQHSCHRWIQDCQPPWERAGNGAGTTAATAWPRAREGCWKMVASTWFNQWIYTFSCQIWSGLVSNIYIYMYVCDNMIYVKYVISCWYL